MKRAFASPVPEADATRKAIAAAVPKLRTERLILRAPRAEDFAVLEPIWRTDRGRFIGGPFNEEDAWLDFAQAAGAWLLRGLGYWTVTRIADDAVLGLIGIGQETVDPELEFGWLLTEQAEGAGYAFEACTAVRAYAFDTLGLTTLISFIDRRNTRSVALAERLGASLDMSALPADVADEDFAFRHTARGVQ